MWRCSKLNQIDHRTFAHKAELPVELKRSKLCSSVNILSAASERWRKFDAIIDTGSALTHVSKSLFAGLGYPGEISTDPIPVKVTGATDAEGEGVSGVSHLVNGLRLNDLNLGSVRVVVADLGEDLKSVVILGMNVLRWFNLNVEFVHQRIALTECPPPIHIEGFRPCDRFTFFDREFGLDHRVFNTLFTDVSQPAL